MAEIGAADLRFRPDEIARFFEVNVAALPPATVDALASRTEGWPAGVQMAALALGRRPDPASLIASFSGSHRFVVDFLTSEVLRGQPPAVRRFLEETSLLDRLTADLCAAVTDRADSQRLLEEIERQNLFLEPLDDRRGWWRYHRLFADALRARLETTEPERANAIHRRASQWFRREGIADQAIAHALAATDFDAAAEVVEAYVDELFLRSERATLERWLSRFPPAVVHARPRLLLARARLALQRGDPSAATPWLDRADAALSGAGAGSDGYTPSVGPALSITANPRAALALNRAIATEFSGDHRRTLALLDTAVSLARDGEVTLVAIARGHMGGAEWQAGHLDAAERHLLEAHRLSAAAGQPSLAAWADFYRGQVELARGDLAAAERTYRRVVEETSVPGSAPLPAAGVGHAGLAAVALERDDLDASRRHLETALPLCRALAFSPAWASSLATLARLKRAQGDVAGALSVLDQEGREAAPRQPVVSVLDPIRSEWARLALADGRRGEVLEWADAAVSTPGPSYVREAEDLVHARSLLADGEAHPALARLGPHARLASTEGRTRSLIEIRLVEALARAALGDAEGARLALEEALDLPADTGHVRLFAEQGDELGGLMAEVFPDDGGLPDRKRLHLRRIRRAMAPGRPGPGAGQSGLIDPLSARELEVLALVAAGRTNRQIADDLFIAVDTVKRHLTHILAKLGASNRTQAAARARRLGLVD